MLSLVGSSSMLPWRPWHVLHLLCSCSWTALSLLSRFDHLLILTNILLHHLYIIVITLLR